MIRVLRIAPQEGNIEVGKREGNRKNNASAEQNNASAEKKQIGSAEHFQDSSDEQWFYQHQLENYFNATFPSSVNSMLS